MFDSVGELLDEIVRHALLEALAAVEDGDALRVGREEQRRLTRRVAGTDDVDVPAVRARRFAARGSVEDASAGKTVEAVDRQVSPRDAAGENDRPRLQDVATVEVHLVRRSVDARDRAGDEDLGAEPARLLKRAARERVAGDARREAEVVLDPRRRARLATGRLALDHDRPQPLGGAVDGGRQPGGPRADDHRVVLRGHRLGRDVRAAPPRAAAAVARRSSR